MIDTVYTNFLHSGAILRMNKLVNKSEGQMREICVLIDFYESLYRATTRESHPLSFVFISATSGKC